jgi:hypothetical protein
LFKRLHSKYGWDNDRVTAIIEQLEANEINTVGVLKENWEEIKKVVKMTIGIKRGVEDAFKEIN